MKWFGIDQVMAGIYAGCVTKALQSQLSGLCLFVTETSHDGATLAAVPYNHRSWSCPMISRPTNLSSTRRAALLAVFLAGNALVSGCATMAGPKSLADTIAADPELSTLSGLLKSAGLSEQLAGAGPLTVFAPTNAAFKAVPAKTMEDLGRQPQLLKEVLTYHVVTGTWMAKDIKNGKVKTLNGASLELSKAGTFVTVESAAVTRADLTATNGTVHVIDTVLLPPKK